MIKSDGSFVTSINIYWSYKGKSLSHILKQLIFHYSKDSQSRSLWSPKEYFDMSGETFVCHNWEDATGI